MQASASQDTPEPPVDGLTKIVIGEIDHPLAELVPYDAPPSLPMKPVTLDPNVKLAISNLVRGLPTAVTASLHAVSPTYLLRFSPDVVAQLSAGNATLMQALGGGARAIVVDSGGKIIGHGTLVSTAGLSSAATATLLWQTLAIITAQHYLPDIQQQLAAITHTLKELKTWMLLKEQAQLIAHEEYLRDVVRVIEQGAAAELDFPAIKVQVEQIDRECTAVRELMRLIMERQHAHLREAPITGWFTWEVERNVTAAQTYGDDFDHAMRGFAATVRIKAMIAAFRSHILLQPQISHMRLTDAHADSQRGRVMLTQFYDLVTSRVDDVWANTELFGALGPLRTAIRQEGAERRATLRKGLDRLDAELEQALEHAAALRDGRREPAALIIQHDDDGTLLAFTTITEPDVKQAAPAAQG